MKHVVLFGGSFNPPHIGHFEMAKYITQTLPVDEVWFLFSHNIDKDPAIYAPLEHRMAMGDILKADYKDDPFIMSDAEYKTGTHLTADVLPKIEEMYPNHKFIWAMGADNLTHFHLWEGYEKIIEQYPILIFNRAGAEQKRYPAFEDYDRYMCSNVREIIHRKNGVHFLDNPYINLSSTEIRNALIRGEEISSPLADYIQTHKLYI